MTLSLHEKNSAISSELEILQKKRDELNAEISAFQVEQRKIEEEIFKESLRNDPEDWIRTLEAVNDRGIEVGYHEKKKKIESLGLRNSGMFSLDSKQYIIRISLAKMDKEGLEKTTDGLKKILPFIKKIKRGYLDSYYKIIDIFEHTLSEFGIYELAIIEEENLFAIAKTTYGQFAIKNRFKTLEEALSFIQKNHYYE